MPSDIIDLSFLPDPFIHIINNKVISNLSTKINTDFLIFSIKSVILIIKLRCGNSTSALRSCHCYS